MDWGISVVQRILDLEHQTFSSTRPHRPHVISTNPNDMVIFTDTVAVASDIKDPAIVVMEPVGVTVDPKNTTVVTTDTVGLAADLKDPAVVTTDPVGEAADSKDPPKLSPRTSFHFLLLLLFLFFLDDFFEIRSLCVATDLRCCKTFCLKFCPLFKCYLHVYYVRSMYSVHSSGKLKFDWALFAVNT